MTMSVEELQSKWIDVCIEKGLTLDAFSLSNALPLIFHGDQHIVLSNQTLELQSLNPSHVNEVYITEQELRRLWTERSLGLLGKPISKFDISEALLLVEDDEDKSLLEESSSSTHLEMKEMQSVVDVETAEIFITETVLISSLYEVFHIDSGASTTMG